jgi:hypothetical protein
MSLTESDANNHKLNNQIAMVVIICKHNTTIIIMTTIRNFTTQGDVQRWTSCREMQVLHPSNSPEQLTNKHHAGG